MTNPNKSLIVLILDDSGSMKFQAPKMNEAMISFIGTQKALPGECEVSVTKFGDECGKSVVGDIETLVFPEITGDSGMTALYDAIGTVVGRVGENLAKLNEADRPGKVIVVIVTDGLENKSTKFTSATVNAIIKEQTDTYKWEFIYLGANQDSFAVSQSMGIAMGKTMNYDFTAQGAMAGVAPKGFTGPKGKMTDELAKSVSQFRSGSKSGVEIDYKPVDTAK
jgi:uncharacterized protein YegL